MKMRKNEKIFVAMSGGVDSSVAALLLKKQGYDVVGVFMKFWHDTDSLGLYTDRHGHESNFPRKSVFSPYQSASRENRCCSSEARRDAMAVCAKLKIPFLTWNFQKEFRQTVVDDFISGYKKGITPNPCVVCNKEIKFGLFLKKALKMGTDYIATGHYVRLREIKNPAFDGAFDESRDKPKCLGLTPTNRLADIANLSTAYLLYQAKDRNKDQSYFLWTLTQKQLKHCLFPIGNYLKSEVRRIAKKADLLAALKKESQEVCFVKDAPARRLGLRSHFGEGSSLGAGGDLAGFLRKWIKPRKGEIIELKTGKKLAEHQGVQFYTIGQRVPVGGTGPYFVADKNLKKNQLLVVGKTDKNPLHKEITLKNVNWISGEPSKSIKILVRTRYRQPLAAATLITADKKQINADRNPRQSVSKSASIRVLFENAQKAVAPGQSAVFYNRDGELLGGGVII